MENISMHVNETTQSILDTNVDKHFRIFDKFIGVNFPDFKLNPAMYVTIR